MISLRRVLGTFAHAISNGRAVFSFMILLLPSSLSWQNSLPLFRRSPIYFSTVLSSMGLG